MGGKDGAVSVNHCWDENVDVGTQSQGFWKRGGLWEEMRMVLWWCERPKGRHSLGMQWISHKRNRLRGVPNQWQEKKYNVECFSNSDTLRRFGVLFMSFIHCLWRPSRQKTLLVNVKMMLSGQSSNNDALINLSIYLVACFCFVGFFFCLD